MVTVIESTLEAFKKLNKWVTARELYDFMVKNAYYVGNSKTPKDTISATCVRFCQDGLLKEPVALSLKGTECEIQEQELKKQYSECIGVSAENIDLILWPEQ